MHFRLLQEEANRNYPINFFQNWLMAKIAANTYKAYIGHPIKD